MDIVYEDLRVFLCMSVVPILLQCNSSCYSIIRNHISGLKFIKSFNFFFHKTKVKAQYESCCNVSPLVLTTQTQLSTVVEFRVKWQYTQRRTFNQSDMTLCRRFFKYLK